jgi:hypothetical protein
VIAATAVTVAFAFSRYGGNIVPFQARISLAGRVIVNKKPHGVLTHAQLAALQRLVDKERFASLPGRITCPGVLPDIATRSVTATSHGKRRSVSVRGGCNRRFDRVYAALARAAKLDGS